MKNYEFNSLNCISIETVHASSVSFHLSGNSDFFEKKWMFTKRRGVAVGLKEERVLQ